MTAGPVRSGRFGDLTTAVCAAITTVIARCRRGLNIRSGFGESGFLKSTPNLVLAGDLGRGTGSFLREGCLRVSSLGNSAVESHCVQDGSVIGRVSVADASLSLGNLSLLARLSKLRLL